MIRKAMESHTTTFSKDAEKRFLQGRDHIVDLSLGIGLRRGLNEYFKWNTDPITMNYLNEMANEIARKSKLPGSEDAQYEFNFLYIGPVLKRKGEHPADNYEVGVLFAKVRKGAPELDALAWNIDRVSAENRELDNHVLFGVIKGLHTFKEKSWNERRREIGALDAILFPGNWRSQRDANLGNAAPGRPALPEDVAKLIKEYVGVNKNLRNPLSRLTNTKRRRANNKPRGSLMNRLFGRNRSRKVMPEPNS